jgi:hypothetical protein
VSEWRNAVGVLSFLPYLKGLMKIQTIRNHMISLVSVSLCAVILIVVFVLDIDVFNLGVSALARIESGKIDDVIIGALILVVGLMTDLFLARGREKRSQEKRQAELEQNRLRVLQATMRTVQDLVKNFVNNLQLIRMDAEEAPLSLESLELFDELIFGTAAQLKPLGDSKNVTETQMASGIGIRIPDTQAA